MFVLAVHVCEECNVYGLKYGQGNVEENAALCNLMCFGTMNLSLGFLVHIS